MNYYEKYIASAEYHDEAARLAVEEGLDGIEYHQSMAREAREAAAAERPI